MFNFFKIKELASKYANLEIFHCFVCNGNYYEENIDFFVSRRLSKSVCVRCVEYMKDNSNKEKEVSIEMKNLETIIKNRDALKKSIDNLWAEIIAIKDGREWSELSKEEKSIGGKLLGLKAHYFDQWVALNFVLNEDSRLMDCKMDRNYEGVDERFFAEINNI